MLGYTLGYTFMSLPTLFSSENRHVIFGTFSISEKLDLGFKPKDKEEGDILM